MEHLIKKKKNKRKEKKKKRDGTLRKRCEKSNDCK
jgi:hypothetical protein